MAGHKTQCERTGPSSKRDFIFFLIKELKTIEFLAKMIIEQKFAI
jgi:hypothetical protein